MIAASSKLALALAQLLGVVAPVPGGELEVAALLRDQRLHGVAVGQRARPRRLPDPLQQAAHGLRRLGHGILEPVGGEGRVAQDAGALLAQPQDLDDVGVVVVGVAVVAAGDEGLEHLLAQVAAGRALQERLDRGARQRHHRLAGLAALFGGGLGGGDEAVGQAGAVVLAELQRPALLVGKQVVAEAGAEMGQPLVDLGHPLLGGLVEAGAGAVEADVGPLQQPHLLAGQPERGAVVVQLRDPAEQHGVHHDRIPVPRHPQRDLLVDLQHRRVRVRRDQGVEHRRDLGEQLAGALQRRDGVVEVGRRRIVNDCGDLGRVVGEGLLEGRQEVLRRDLVERRRLERRLPGRQQRVVPCFRGGRRRAEAFDIANPVFAANLRRIYITRCGIFGPFALDTRRPFQRHCGPQTGPTMSMQPTSTSCPPDRLAERHHRHLGGDPDRRRGVRRGVRRRLGARDPDGPRRHLRAHHPGGAVCHRRRSSWWRSCAPRSASSPSRAAR